jgi:DNA primase
VIGNNQTVKKVKVNRPKALCFDYLQLKEMFGLDLETEMVTDDVDFQEENTATHNNPT